MSFATMPSSAPRSVALSAPVGAPVPAHRAYDGQRGFNLAWVGTDITYDGGEVGATASLRMGQGNSQFFDHRDPDMVRWLAARRLDS